MPKILVIDDDPDVRMLMNVLMKKQGYEVQTAYNKEDALIKLQNFQPSVILLDVLLSGTDGREFCKQIKETEELHAIPVIMISAHPGAAENFAGYGADDFISKPINSENLLKKVDRLLNVPK
jgi:DNA-binding response OmpR family regulator